MYLLDISKINFSARGSVLRWNGRVSYLLAVLLLDLEADLDLIIPLGTEDLLKLIDEFA